MEAHHVRKHDGYELVLFGPDGHSSIESSFCETFILFRLRDGKGKELTVDAHQDTTFQAEWRRQIPTGDEPEIREAAVPRRWLCRSGTEE
jgi:hypothetical protein